MSICAAVGCSCRISSSMLMCREHWFKVPSVTRDWVWNTYRSGLKTGLHPTWAWCEAADAAVAAVAKKEGKDVDIAKTLTRTFYPAGRPYLR